MQPAIFNRREYYSAKSRTASPVEPAYCQFADLMVQRQLWEASPDAELLPKQSSAKPCPSFGRATGVWFGLVLL